jgi:hypothetical protein
MRKSTDKTEGFSESSDCRRGVRTSQSRRLSQGAGLVDLCRQRIVFDSLADLALCLRVMEDDPEVHLVRIKNRMDPGHPSLVSGGYLDASVNPSLKVISERTKGLGLAMYVCEVQLILKRFAEVKVRSRPCRQALTPQLCPAVILGEPCTR